MREFMEKYIREYSIIMRYSIIFLAIMENKSRKNSLWMERIIYFYGGGEEGS